MMPEKELSGNIKKDLNKVIKTMKEDGGLAWAWHCNVAMVIRDTTGLPMKKCNQTAANLMSHLFGIDTSLNKNYGYWSK